MFFMLIRKSIVVISRYFWLLMLRLSTRAIDETTFSAEIPQQHLIKIYVLMILEEEPGNSGCKSRRDETANLLKRTSERTNVEGNLDGPSYTHTVYAASAFWADYHIIWPEKRFVARSPITLHKYTVLVQGPRARSHARHKINISAHARSG